MTTPSPKPLRRERLPWAITAAALVAFTALAASGGVTPVLPLLAVALLGTYIFDVRIGPRAWWVHWVLRLALDAGIGTMISSRTDEGLADSFLSSSVMEYVGQWAAAEVVIQAWRRQPPGQTAVGPLIFLSGLTLMASCQTSDEQYPRLFVPAYMLFVLLSLGRGTGMRAVPWAAVGIALGAGAVTYGAVWTNRVALTAWGTQYLDGRPAPEVTGLSTDPTLGETFGLRGSPRRVLRITALRGVTYLRALSFDTYRDGRWGPDLAARQFSRAVLSPSAHGVRAQVTPLAATDGLLLAPLNCAGVDAGDNRDLKWASETGGPLQGRDSQVEPYEIIQGRDAQHQGPLAVPPSPAALAHDLALPADLDPRIRVLAAQVGGQVDGAQGRAAAVADYLISHHRYSLTIHPGPGDPLTSFLLDTPAKGAHCEYFAAAAAILLRCLGVPTRYVEGYYAHESDGPGVTVVRQRDAHAWTEAWVPGTGWVTVDATPGDGRPEQGVTSVPPWQLFTEQVADAAVAVRAWLLGLDWPRGALVLGGVAVTFLLLRAGWRFRRRPAAVTAPDAVYSHGDPDLAVLTSRFEAALTRQGAPCPPGRPWGEHVTAAGLAGDAADAFLRAYNAARFGRQSEEDLARLPDLLSETEQQWDHRKGQG